jgi:hypothetical protein
MPPFAGRDADAAVKHVAADCELHLRGTADLAGRSDPYLGHAGVHEYFADVAATWQELVLYPDDYRALPGL